MTTSKPHVLMLGHSFVQQNLEFIVKRIDTVQSLTYLTFDILLFMVLEVIPSTK